MCEILMPILEDFFFFFPHYVLLKRLSAATVGLNVLLPGHQEVCASLIPSSYRDGAKLNWLFTFALVAWNWKGMIPGRGVYVCVCVFYSGLRLQM